MSQGTDIQFFQPAEEMNFSSSNQSKKKRKRVSETVSILDETLEKVLKIAPRTDPNISSSPESNKSPESNIKTKKLKTKHNENPPSVQSSHINKSNENNNNSLSDVDDDDDLLNKYKPPESFVPLKVDDINKIQLDYDQIISPETELWLIKVPKDLDTEKLDNMKIKLDLDSQINIDPILSNIKIQDKAYTIYAGDIVEYEQLINIFPSEREKTWNLGKPFSRQLSIIETFENMPSVKEPLNTELTIEKQKPLPEFKVRFTPAGFDSKGPSYPDKNVVASPPTPPARTKNKDSTNKKKKKKKEKAKDSDNE